jgi:prepilin-type N-terminal cleavage/methylation domain-containing protein
MMSKKWQTDNGFTAIEAIMVIIIIGILASVLVYRLNVSQGTGITVAADQLIADIQYIQARAMGTGAPQSITFTVGSGTYNLPGEPKGLPGGITVISTTLSGNSLTFNTLGEPLFGATDRTITLSGSRTLTVYAITGKVE